MFTEINGIKLYYEDKGQGPAFVFIHGLGESAPSWHFQTDFFSKSFRTVAMDLRGHAQSEDGDTTITLDLLASDVIGLLDYLGIEIAHFIGHSMGGVILQEIAARYPERMLSIILSSTAGFFKPPVNTTNLELRLERIDTLPMSELGALIAKIACAPDFEQRQPEIFTEIKKTFQQNRTIPYRQATLAVFGSELSDHRSSSAKIKVPTLIMVGELDQTTPLTDSFNLLKLIPGSKMQILRNAAHLTKYEVPQDYNRAIVEFLAPYEPEVVLPLLCTFRKNILLGNSFLLQYPE